ncbi:MAG: hypothetical protein ACTFAK_15610 [Candidatus Electronema sp. VV]
MMKGKGKLPGWLLAAGILLASAAADTASAAPGCGVYSSSPGGAAGRRYQSCEDCLNRHRRCEERCVETGHVCTASGYGRHGRMNRVEGDVADRERGARRNALERCREQGLRDCAVERCTEERRRERTQPCRRSGGGSIGWNRPQPDPPAVVPSAPFQPPRPQRPYVVSWQHVKEQCMSQPYHKIAQQCGNRVGFWHGIRCQVTWSDGRTENLGGKVDLTDPYGRRYCTRDTRPANFNCVSQCDNSPGPLINLPKP